MAWADPLDWTQTGKDAGHSSFENVPGQGFRSVLGQFVLDANAGDELKDQGDILVHYQSPLLVGNDVYSELKGGKYSPASNQTGWIDWSTQTWSEQKLSWDANGNLQSKWIYESDWKPTPMTTNPAVTLGAGIGPAWEPVFGAAVTSQGVWVPETGGQVALVDKTTGSLIKLFNPYPSAADPSTLYTTSPITADNQGNIYYTAVQFDIPSTIADPEARANSAWSYDILGAWLVQVDTKGQIHLASFDSLTPGAISKNAQCEFSFPASALPFPSTTVPVQTNRCGSQRAGINVMPAVAPNGNVYVVSRTHFNSRYGYLVAVSPKLKPLWIASFRDRLNDGCNVLVPATGTPGGCRAGATDGVDPNTNNRPAGRVLDDSSASPTIAPDGSVFIGTYTRYNFAQGHMFHFDKNGNFLNSYLFGWDATPGIYPHDNTYSVIFKENHYGGLGSYCNDPVICPPDRAGLYPNDPEAYFLSQFSPNLTRQWAYQNTNTLSCKSNGSGQPICKSTNPNGFEWCVNSVVTDSNGTVYGASEDGNIYAVSQGGTLAAKKFLSLSLGAAYTPTALDSAGRLYAQNYGLVFVLGR